MVGGLTTMQQGQLRDLCHYLLATQRNKISLEELTDERYNPAECTALPDDFPILNVSAVKSPRLIYRSHFADSLAVIPTIEALSNANASEKIFKLQHSNAKGHERKLRLANPSEASAGAPSSESRGSRLRILDLGTGGGLPGLVLAIARPDWEITLVDSVKRKCAFIQDTAARLGLANVTVVAERGEFLSSLRQGRRHIGHLLALEQLSKNGTSMETFNQHQSPYGPYLCKPPKGYIAPELVQQALRAAAAYHPNPLPKPTSHDTPYYHAAVLDEITERAPYMYAYDPHIRESYDFVVSRAMANPAMLMEIGMPLIKPRGHLIMMKFVERPRTNVPLEALSKTKYAGATIIERKKSSVIISEPPMKYDPVPQLWASLNNTNPDLVLATRMAHLVGGTKSPKYVDYTQLVPVSHDDITTEATAKEPEEESSENSTESSTLESSTLNKDGTSEQPKNANSSSKCRVLAVVQKKYYTPVCYPREGTALGAAPPKQPQTKPAKGEGVALAKPFTAAVVHRVAEQLIRARGLRLALDQDSAQVYDLDQDDAAALADTLLQPQLYEDLTKTENDGRDQAAQTKQAKREAAQKRAEQLESQRAKKQEARRLSEARARAWRLAAVREGEAGDSTTLKEHSTANFEEDSFDRTPVPGSSEEAVNRRSWKGQVTAPTSKPTSKPSTSSKAKSSRTTRRDEDIIGVKVDLKNNPIAAALAARAQGSLEREENLRERLEREEREMRDIRKKAEKEWSVAYRSSTATKQTEAEPSSSDDWTSAADVGIDEVKRWEAFIRSEKRKSEMAAKREAEAASKAPPTAPSTTE